MNSLRTHFQKYRATYLWVGCLVFVAAAVAIPVFAQSTGSTTATAPKDQTVNKLYQLISNLVLVLVQAVANLTALFTHILIWVSSYGTDGQGFINTPLVRTGWALIRDITNMFFIISLLMIAAGTVLRIENYRYNRLLARVIIMAFLVNYSRLISGFLIQTSQVVMLTFVNSYKEALFGNFASMFGLDRVLQFASTGNNTLRDSAQDFGVILMSLVVGLGLMIAALVVTITMTVILIVRVVALWILTILSPLAYGLRVLPNTERYAQRWWSEMGRYLTVGPIMAFFLWLALLLVVSTGQSTLGSIADQAADYPVKLSTSIDQPFANQILTFSDLSAFMVGIIFLIMGIRYATGSGAAGARMAGTIGKGVGLNVSGARWLQNRTVRPVQSWYKARQDRSRDAVGRRAQGLTRTTDRVTSGLIGKPAAVLQGARQGVAAAGQQAIVQSGRVAAAGVGALRAAGQVAKTGAQRAQNAITPEQAQQQMQAAKGLAAASVGQVGTAIGRVVGREGFTGGALAGVTLGTEGERIRQAEIRKSVESQRNFREGLNTPERMSENARRAVAVHGENGDVRMQAAQVMALNREIDMKEKDATKLDENKRLAADLGRDKLRRSTTVGALSQSINNIDPEVVEHMFAQFGEKGKFNANNQLLLSGIGRFSEAFGAGTDKAVTYIENNSRRVKDLIKKGLVSTGSLDPETYRPLIEKIHDLPGIGDEEWTEGLKANKTLSDAYAQMSSTLAPEFNAKGKEGYDEKSKWMNVVREVQSQASKGGNMKFKDKDGKEQEVNVFEKMYLDGASDVKKAQEELAKVIRANGKEFSKFDFQDAKTKDSVKETFRDNISVGGLASILEKNSSLVDDVFKEWKKVLDGQSAVSDEVRESIKKKVKRSRSNDLLAGYTAAFKNVDEDESDDEAQGGPTRSPRQPRSPRSGGPQTNPGDDTSARRQAGRSQPAQPGGRILAP